MRTVGLDHPHNVLLHLHPVERRERGGRAGGRQCATLLGERNANGGVCATPRRDFGQKLLAGLLQADRLLSLPPLCALEPRQRGRNLLERSRVRRAAPRIVTPPRHLMALPIPRRAPCRGHPRRDQRPPPGVPPSRCVCAPQAPGQTRTPPLALSPQLRSADRGGSRTTNTTRR